MPVTSVAWVSGAGEDIHLAGGLVSPRLDQLLELTHTLGRMRGDAPPPGVTVSFAVDFTPAANTAHVGFDATTGTVTVFNILPPAPRLLRFRVTATVVEGGTTFTRSIRFHLHDSIEQIWLTPARLTVRLGARNVRFTVLARFDDGTYGDITNWSPATAPLSRDLTFVHSMADPSTPILSWRRSDLPDDVAIDPVTGILNCQSLIATADITVETTPAPAPATERAVGAVEGTYSWDTPVDLEWLSGPGFAAMPTSPNVLILPDGFQRSEADAFRRLAQQLVNALNTRPMTRPFDLFKDRMNYFMAWVESPDAGVSSSAVVKISGSAAKTAVEVEDPFPTSPVVGSPPTSSNRLYLLNERDTAFHTTRGERPRADGTSLTRSYAIRSGRIADADFDAFLHYLRDDAGHYVGDVWASGGKDEGLILIIARSRRYGGSNQKRKPSGRYICFSLVDGDDHVVSTGAAGFDVAACPIPQDLSIHVWTLAAHELGHSLSLDDEYGGDYTGSVSSASYPEVHSYRNVVLRADLLSLNDLSGAGIPWRWRRVAKAGVLAAPPQRSGSRFTLTLEPGHAAAFVEGDLVRLRVAGLPPFHHDSPRLRVAQNPTGDALELAVVPGSSAPAGTYPAGSLVFAPVRGAPTDADPAGPDLELVHANVLARITSTKNPLNVYHESGPNAACIDQKPKVPTSARNFPGGIAPKPPEYSAWIVGLYDGGSGYNCGIYHPTGVCVMAVRRYIDLAAGGTRAYQFCPVCRYIMVDLMDPTKHGEIDRDYAERYPR